MGDLSERYLQDEVLTAIAKRAQAQYLDIALPLEQFCLFLARRIPKDAPDPAAIEALRIEDLYLACAYGLGIQAAQVRVERDHFSRIERRLNRMAVPPPDIAEVLQELRCSLLDLQNPASVGRGYAGRGSLGGWLFVAAIRIAERQRSRAHQEISESELRSSMQNQLLLAVDPEMEHLLHSYKAAFEVAVQEGLAALPVRERNLLRYYFLERLSIDRLAEIYKIHRATAARWVQHAQKHLADEIYGRFAAQIPIDAESMPRLLELIRSKLNLSLSEALHQAEPES